MSALWTDRYTAVIGSDHVAVMHTRSELFRRKIIAEKRSSLSLSGNKAADNKLIMTTLSALFGQMKLQGGKLDIMLAGRFVHLGVLPPLDQALKRGEQLKRIQLHFERVFGAMAAQWSFSTSPAKYQQPVLAAAMDQSLLSDFRQLAESLHLKLVTVEPVLMCILRHWKNRLIKQPIWLIVAESTCYSLLKIERGSVTAVSQATYGEDFSGDALQAVLTREALRLGETLQGKTLYLFSPHKSGLSVEVQGVRLQQLHLPVADAGNTFSASRLLKMSWNA